jgi:hypothetical protein
MAFIRSKKNTNKSRRSTQSSLLPHQIFPGNIRNELRMTCVLRGYSALREGFGMSQVAQQESLFNFFHGNGDKQPSQIEMLADGIEKKTKCHC